MTDAAGNNISIVQNGERSVILRFEEEPGEGLMRKVIGYGMALERSGPGHLIDVVPAYSSLMLHYDPSTSSREEIESLIAGVLEDEPSVDFKAAPKMVIPVCYDRSVAPDLDHVASHCQISADELIDRHISGAYRVYMLGFIPGFVYLGGLDAALACPRRSRPRVRVEKGSVGIAGIQTGIYSLESPGGWQILGRTPVSLFDPLVESPFLASHFQEIEFSAISLDEANRWSK